MDILTYIDRVKANYSKQPEPVYNTKKYFTGGRVGFDKGGDVENLKKLLKSNDPKFFEKFKKIQNKHFNGNFKTTAESIGNMEAIKAKFNRANIEQGGQGPKLKTTIEPKGETLRQTDFTTKLNKNPDMLKKYSKSKEYLTINNLANKVGIDISKRKDRDYLTRTLLELGIENKPLTANIKEYSLSDFAKKINYKTKIKGEQKSQSVRNKNISKVDPELDALEKKIINNVARSSKQEGVFIARAVEDAGHAVSVNLANKYPNLIKDSNILDIQSRVYQDPKVNMDILNKKGFDSRFDSVFKELNSLVNKPVTQETRKQLINLKNKMSSIRDESIEAIKKETKKFPYLKGQEKRIPKLDIKIPDVGQKFESKNLFVDMSVVDQKYRVGNINKVNPKAKKLTDLNPQELEKYKTNMFAQNSDNVQKFYTAVKDKKTGQEVFSKVDIDDLGEAIETDSPFHTELMKYCGKRKNTGGSAGVCSIEEATDGLKNALTKSKGNPAQMSKFKNILKTGGKFFGWVDAPIELVFALPGLLKGDKDEALRATTLGLFGAGRSELEKLDPNSPAYKTSKGKQDVNDYVKNYFQAQDLEKKLNDPKLDKVNKEYLTNLYNDKVDKVDKIKSEYVPSSLQDEVAANKQIRDQEKEEADKGFEQPDGSLATSNYAKDLDLSNAYDYFKYKGDPGYNRNKVAAEQLGLDNFYGDFTGKELEDRYSDLPTNIASSVADAEKKQVDESRQKKLLEKGLDLSDNRISKYGIRALKGTANFLGFASGGLADLTRTIAPKKGPQSEGLAYFMKNGKK